MFFLMSKLLGPLLAPGNALAVLGVLGVLLRVRPRTRRAGSRCLGVAALSFAALTVLPIGDGLIRPLENRFPVPRPPAAVDGIIVLGGAVDPRLSLDRGQPAVNQAADRLIALPALARRYPGAKLVFTGGSGSLAEPDGREAPVARTLLVETLGLPADRLLFEGESRNTAENAVLSRRLAAPRAGETWLLVTSAAHMPRAVGVFRAAGWPVLAYPVDFRSRTDGPFLRFDLRTGLDLVTEAAKEWAGLVVYWLSGRSATLFPAPDPVIEATAGVAGG